MVFDQIKKNIENKFPDSFNMIENKNVLFVKADKWEPLMKYLKNDDSLLFDSLLSITGYDTGDKLGAAYNLFSID